MKKGCFFRLIFFIVVVIAIGLYIFQQKYGNIFSSKDTDNNLPLVNFDISSKLDFIKDTQEKLDLEKLLDDVKTNFDKIKDLPAEQIKNISKSFDDIFQDSIITEKELNYIRDKINNLKK